MRQLLFILPVLLVLSCSKDDSQLVDRCCSRIRFLHLSPYTDTVSIAATYYNVKEVLVDSLSYTSSFPATGYLSVDASTDVDEHGWSRLRAYATDVSEADPYSGLSQSMRFEAGIPYTLMLADTGLGAFWLSVPDRAPPVGEADTASAYMRLVNISTQDNLLFSWGEAIGEPAPSLGVSPWLRLPAGRSQFALLNELLAPQQVWRNLPPLEAGKTYQAYFNVDTLVVLSDRYTSN